MLSDFEAINGPVCDVKVTEEQIERLQSAIEGELDGLYVSYEQAEAILRYVLSSEPRTAK